MNLTKLTWLGHGGWSITHDQQTILLDPFLTENPVAPVKANDLSADVILVSHGHFDHIADVPAIARRTGAKVVAVYEIATWLQEHHRIDNAVGMNVGGVLKLPLGSVHMTNAVHSSQLPDGRYGGIASGFVLTIAEQRIYFACDTALFTDMQLLASPPLTVAVLPIGDLYTMGIDDSVQATQWLKPTFVLPAHYNTWPPIAQDAEHWARLVREQTAAQPVVLTPGRFFEVPRGKA